LLTEAIDDYLSGETAVRRSILRDIMNATVGFEAGRSGRKAEQSLHRMIGARGNEQ
jgi:hypothetical protein